MHPIRILTIVGARPQFIKAAMVSRAIMARKSTNTLPALEEDIINTGQHYDDNMSRIFFDEMGIPEPTINLQIGGLSHGEMTGRMLTALEQEMIERRPDWVLVYGDTNTTLAAALAAAKLHIPVAHVESGLRSYNRKMPEEVNRVLTDHVSSLLLCPTSQAVRNLESEGITKGVEQSGDVMFDAARVFGEIAEHHSTIVDDLKLEPGEYALATVHRAENTDHEQRLIGILDALNTLAERCRVILPVHPRTSKFIKMLNLDKLCTRIDILDPVSFLDIVQLERSAQIILTDSGGIQKEAYFHGIPCVTLRDETEWVETVDAGWNQLVGADPQAILKAVDQAGPGKKIDEYGDGQAAETMLRQIIDASQR